MSTTLDPIFKGSDTYVEPEELLEPDLEHSKGTPSRLGALRIRLSDYGNRVLGSGKRLIQVVAETLGNIGTAIVGSIVFLPFLIIGRGVSVLTHNLLAFIKPLILSLLRGILDLICGIFWPFHEAFTGFNKRVLYPAIKRVREDDTAALVAFGLLIVIIVVVIVVLTVVF